MTMKLKLYSTETQLIRSQIEKKLGENRFDEESSLLGFSVLETTKNFIKVNFIEKNITPQEFESPDGNFINIDTVTYTKVKFCIVFNSKFQFHIISPPRKLQHYVDLISSLLGIEKGFSQVHFNINVLVDLFKSNFDLTINTVSLSNIKVNDFTYAKTSLISKNCLYQTLKKDYFDSGAVIDTISLTLDSHKLDLTRAGRIKMQESQMQYFILALEKYDC